MQEAATSGTFPGVSNAQQNDTNGLPLAGGLLTVYQAGSTTPANVFQDIGLVLPTTNPLVADLSGRIPLFFVADGTYALRLTDQFGDQTNGGFYYPQIPSIGASSSGGGGTPVDPTTVFSTGDHKWRPSAETLSGWVRLNGRTIGSASSGASERANADVQALFIYAWNTYPDAKCAVIGGRGANALADFNGNKQITLLDMRGRVAIGLDDMGNAASGRITTTNMPGSTDTPTTAAGYGGESLHTLSTPEIPAHTHSNALNDPGHNHTYGPAALISSTTSGGVPGFWNGTNNNSFGTTSNTTGVTINNASAGGGSAHNIMQSFVLGTSFWKL